MLTHQILFFLIIVCSILAIFLFWGRLHLQYVSPPSLIIFGEKLSVPKNEIVSQRKAERPVPNQRNLANCFSDVPFMKEHQKPLNYIRPSLFPLQPPPTEAPKFLQTYIRWHAEQRLCLSNVNCSVGPRLLISRCPIRKNCLGLGDRLRGVYFAFWLAVLSNRVLFIDWPDMPYDITLGMVPSAIDWTLPVAQFPSLLLNGSSPYLEFDTACNEDDGCYVTFPDRTHERGTLPPIPLDFQYDDLNAKLGRYPFLSVYSRASKTEVLNFGNNPHYSSRYRGYWTLQAQKAVKTVMLQSLFRPSENTLQLMSKTPFSRDASYFGVHIRTGDDVEEGHIERFQGVSKKRNEIAQLFVSCVARLREGRRLPGRVFLASDSEEMRTSLQRIFEGKGFEVGALESQVMHVGKMRLYKERLERKEPLCEAFLAVFADLFFLVEAKIVVGTKSHFSRMATDMATNSELITLGIGDDVKTVCQMNGGYHTNEG